MRFSDQIPRTGPGPCYKYLRKLRDRCTDLFLRLASSSRFFSPRRKSLSLLLFPSIACLLFICLDRERKKERLQEREKKKQEPVLRVYFGRNELSAERERERERLAMAIRLYVLRVFEQFSCTEDPVASNPYRESRLHGGERGRGKGEGEGERRRRWRRRPVTKLGRSLGERERSDSCSSLDRTQHPRNVSSFILN